jgi:micrococcal nuclease
MGRRRPLSFRLATVAVIILAVLVGRWWGRERKPEFPPGRYIVTRILDGDTAELNGSEKVRLLGIDTPEKGELFYDSARALFSSLTKGREVTVVFDQRRRDNYDRLLAYLFVDTVFVNAALISGGYAHMYLFPDNENKDTLIARLLAAQREAMARQTGVWSVPVAGETSYVGNSRQMRFHRPGCRSAEKLTGRSKVVFSSREEAMFNGYSPCRNCKP